MAVLGAVVVPLFIRWLIRSSRSELLETETSPDEFTMKPSRAARQMAFACIVFLAVADAGFLYYTRYFPKLAIGLGIVFMFPLSIFFLYPLNELRRRVHVSKDGLKSFSPWRGKKSATWSEIESVRFREWGQTIRVSLRDGGVIVIPSTTMAGVPLLETRMRDHLPLATFENAFQRYHAFADGRR